MEHIDTVCSLKSVLSFDSICSVEILDIFEVIVKMSFSKITKCSTLVKVIVGLYYDHIGFESEPRFISSGGSDMGYPTTFEISQKTKHAQPLEIHQKTNCIFDMSSHGIDVNLVTLAKSPNAQYDYTKRLYVQYLYGK